MISLTCTSCKRSLEIDDAFAGGVCRCQYCGTIQTVPASLKQGGRPATPVGRSPGTQKTLYEKQSAATARGATSTGVPPEMPPTLAATPRASRAAQPVAAPETVKKNTWLIGIGVGVAAACVIGVIAWIAM
jgi:hypothetical protein